MFMDLCEGGQTSDLGHERPRQKFEGVWVGKFLSCTLRDGEKALTWTLDLCNRLRKAWFTWAPARSGNTYIRPLQQAACVIKVEGETQI